MVRKPNLEGGKKGSKTNKEYLYAYAHTDRHVDEKLRKEVRKEKAMVFFVRSFVIEGSHSPPG
jgi:hypothetical protein